METNEPATVNPSSHTTIVPARLRDDELMMLDYCRNADGRSNVVATLNRSELIRLLILREYKRRTTQKSVVASKEYSTDFRTGQPRKRARV